MEEPNLGLGVVGETGSVHGRQYPQGYTYSTFKETRRMKVSPSGSPSTFPVYGESGFQKSSWRTPLAGYRSDGLQCRVYRGRMYN